jgi:hypothetical protein
MIKSSHAFVRFLNLYRSLRQESETSDALKPQHPEAVAILAFVSAQNELGIATTATHIVQKNEFGTPPTIQRRMKELLDSRFIEFYEGSDKRQRLLRSTTSGENYLEKCSKLMFEALGGGSCPS